MKSAILITYDKEDAINEAKGLCDAAGYEIVHTIKQKFLKRPKYGISGRNFRTTRRNFRKIKTRCNCL